MGYEKRTPLIYKMICCEEREREKEPFCMAKSWGNLGEDMGDRRRNLATPDPCLANPVIWFRMASGPKEEHPFV